MLEQIDENPEEADHIVAHRIKEYRRERHNPYRAIKLFHYFEIFAEDHMYIAVAAAYADVDDFEAALKYAQKAGPSEYKTNLLDRIRRQMLELEWY